MLYIASNYELHIDETVRLRKSLVHRGCCSHGDNAVAEATLVGSKAPADKQADSLQELCTQEHNITTRIPITCVASFSISVTEELLDHC